MTRLPTLQDCWNRIGVRGDGSCPELAVHIHCRNCPVHAAAAAEMVDRELPDGYLREWTDKVAIERIAAEPGTTSVVIFRIGAEWLALPTQVFQEVAERSAFHTLPHRRGGVLLGLANVRGEMLLCVSLEAILGMERSAGGQGETRGAYKRLLVVNRDGKGLAFPVDEVHGVHRFHPRELKEVPATLAQAAATYTVGLLPWNAKMVSRLDDDFLFFALNNSLS
jgi:chemotaxis-related protein WspD